MRNIRIISENIKEYVTIRGGTTESLAALLGVTSHRLDSMLCGFVILTFPQLIQVSQYLDVTLENLLDTSKQTIPNSIHCNGVAPSRDAYDAILDFIEHYRSLNLAIV